MVTDGVPKPAQLRAEYVRSDKTRGLELPGDDRFLRAARGIEDALVMEEAAPVRTACVEFLRLAAEYYEVSMPQVRVLRARPIRVREGGWGTELFGDYHFDEKLIRVWMRTAIQKRVTSFGTFLRRSAMSFATIWIANGSDLWKRRIRADSTSAPRRYTTTRALRLRSGSAGCRFPAGGGGSTGRERIGESDRL